VCTLEGTSVTYRDACRSDAALQQRKEEQRPRPQRYARMEWKLAVVAIIMFLFAYVAAYRTIQRKKKSPYN